jgi:hypothetical protein
MSAQSAAVKHVSSSEACQQLVPLISTSKTDRVFIALLNIENVQ